METEAIQHPVQEVNPEYHAIGIPSVSFDTEREASGLASDFNSQFPDSGIIAAVRYGKETSAGGRWKVLFRGEKALDGQISSWLKSRGVL